MDVKGLLNRIGLQNWLQINYVIISASMVVQKKRTLSHPRDTSWWRTCEVTLRLCRGIERGRPLAHAQGQKNSPKFFLKTVLGTKPDSQTGTKKKNSKSSKPTLKGPSGTQRRPWDPGELWLTLWHSIITYEKWFWNDYFGKKYEFHT